jgi:hypothetical protein
MANAVFHHCKLAYSKKGILQMQTQDVLNKRVLLKKHSCFHAVKGQD